MVRSCVPSFSDLSFLFSHTKTTPRPLSPLKPRSCDLTAIPYTSWRPPTCPQKCDSLCPHLPVGIETRVDGQPVSTTATKKALSIIAEQTHQRETTATIILAAQEEGNESRAGASGSTAGLLTVGVPKASEVNTVDGERTPNLTSLISDDGSESVDLGIERLAKKRSNIADRLTIDWLATLSSLPDESDDNASVLALYDVEFDDDVEPDDNVEQVTRAEDGRSSLHDDGVLLVGGQTASALPLPSIDVEEVAFVDVDLDNDNDDKRYLRPILVPAKQDIDIWCEIALSHSVIKNVAQSLEADVEGKHTGGKEERPLSHIYFFED
ncbi:hypothetical protein N0V86_005807 [Didymella sp. IMI 355093]|nr:hypothetical protein N0V86_005807 [Didymella sp. IMI 355093]